MANFVFCLVLFLVLFIILQVEARIRCPRMCTGHGTCLSDRNRTRLTNPCECYEGYTGIDCSQSND